MHQLFNIRSGTAAHYRRGRYGTFAASIDAAFGDLPDYDKLFGPQDYHAVADERTVYSPAAYFTDLVRLIDANIEPPSSPYDMFALFSDRRRSDLLDILLDVDNTGQLVPALDIVNYVLESLDGASLPVPLTVSEILQNSAWDPPQRVYVDLATRFLPVALPFDLPLKQMTGCLSAMNVDRGSIYDAFTVPCTDAVAAREALNLSLLEFGLITTAATTAQTVDIRWGTPGISDDDVAHLDEVDTFLTATGLTYGDLQAALVQDLQAAEISQAQKFFINAPLAKPDGSYLVISADGHLMRQKDGKQTAIGWSDLDALQRFIRLSRSTGWSFPDLELVIRVCGGVIDVATMTTIASIQKWVNAYQLPIDEICALWAPVKVWGMGNDPIPGDPFDRFFNPRQAVASDAVYRPKTPDNDTFSSDVEDWTPASAGVRASWLRSALGVSSADLNKIANYLSAGAALHLDVPTVSKLRAIAKLAPLFGQSVDDLLWLLQAMCPGGINGVDDFARLESVVVWLTANQMNVGELRQLLTGTVSAATPRSKTDVQVTAFLQSLQAVNANILERDSMLATLVRPPYADVTALIADLERQRRVATFTTTGATPTTWQLIEPLVDAAQHFPGAGDAASSVTISPDAAIPVRSTITLSAWIRPEVFSDSEIVLQKQLPDASNSISITFKNGLVGAEVRWQGSVYACQEPVIVGTITPAGWRHALVTVDLLGGDLTLFVSGRAVASQSFASASLPVPNEGPLLIGGGNPAGAQPFTGSIAKVGMWNWAFDADEAAATFVQGLVVRDRDDVSRCVGYWPLTESSDGTAVNWTGGVSGQIQHGQWAAIEAPLCAPLFSELANLSQNQNDAFEKQLSDFWAAPVWLIRVICPLVASRLGVSRALDYFLSPAAPALTVDDAWKFFDLVQQYLSLAHRLNLTSLEAEVLFGPQAASPFLTRNQITVETLTFDALRQLVDLKSLVLALGDTNDRLLQALNQPSPVLKDVCAAAGWNLTDAQSVIQGLALDAGQWPLISSVMRLHRCFELQTLLGQTIGAMFAFAAHIGFTGAVTADYVTTEFNYARILKTALRASTADDQWPQVQEQALAPLRTQRRDALVASALVTIRMWLAGQKLPESMIADARGLYEYLLIDVEVGPEVQTSLLESGIASLQLYVDRVRTHLEPQTALVDAEAFDTWWRWMKNYRVWEANREVFLYPENYAIPEVREHKSELYEQLEASLQQTAVTPDGIETLYKSYLDGFLELASLRTCGAYASVAADNSTTLYVIGVTQTQPYRHYLRTATYVQGAAGGVWQPWTALDIDIPSASVTPVFAFGKLFVFWAELSSIQRSTWANADNNELAAAKVTSKTQSQAIVRYSFHDSNGHWHSAQILGDPIQKDDPASAPPAFTTDNAQVGATFVPAQGTTAAYIQITFSPAPDADRRLFVDLTSAPGSTPPPAPSPRLLVDATGTLQLFGDLSAFGDIKVLAYYTLDGNLGDQVSKAVGSTSNGSFVPGPFAGSSALQLQGSDYPWAHVTLPFNGSAPVFVGWIAVDGALLDSGELQFEFDVNYHSIRVGMSYTDAANFSQGWHFIVIRFGRPAQLFWDGSPVQWTDPQTKAAANREALSSSFTIENRTGSSKVAHVAILDSISDLQFNALNVAKLGPQPVLGAALGGARLTLIAGRPDWYLFSASGAEWLLKLSVTPEGKSDVSFERLNSSAAPAFCEQLLRDGLSGLLTLDTQRMVDTPLPMSALQPTPFVAQPYPPDTIDFDGASGIYFWEIFFHIPRLLASIYTSHQSFADAQSLLEYIFDPTSVTAGDMPYWRYLPLRIPPVQTTLEQDLKNKAALAAYLNDPFDPHAIAQLRPAAYQKAVVMQYVDNLLEWGDALFSRYTRETLNEAMMLYVFAYDLLGRRPRNLGEYALPAARSFRGLPAGTPGDFIIQLENHTSTASTGTLALKDTPNGYIDIANLYFGIPENDQFTGAFDRVEDRIFKIRHGLNLEGVPQPLPLFDPPLNPMALVQALAAGESLDQATAQAAAVVPHYRFSALMQTARDFTSYVIELGQSLLAALEKKDATQLELLRATQERTLQQATHDLKLQQVTEAQHNLDALNAGLDAANQRQAYYTTLLGAKPGATPSVATSMSDAESTQLDEMKTASEYSQQAAGDQKTASYMHLIPQIGSPMAMTYGGQEFGSFWDAGGVSKNMHAGRHEYLGAKSALVAEYGRRFAEWKQQLQVATNDATQISRQLDAATAAKDIAIDEFTLLQQQILQQQQVESFLATRFTNQELYQWMLGRLSGLYFQAYQLALSLAQQCQTAYQFQTGSTQSFISGNYWDNLHKGLTAGESLRLDLARMEMAYRDADARRFEIQKVISFKRDFPDATLVSDLQTTGKCSFSLDLKMFEQDFPGQIQRQIKSVVVSFPALLGPYQNVGAMLTQVANTTVLTCDPSGASYLLERRTAAVSTPPAGSLRQDWRPRQQIALSRSMNDAGVFELRFDDDRYLPFEGTGAISDWTLELSGPTKALADALTDVVITLNYTALPGTAAYRQQVGKMLSGGR